MFQNLLKDLKFMKTVPSVDVMKHEHYEAPMLVGAPPLSFRQSGFKCVWSYNEMNVLIGFHKVVSAHPGGMIQLQTVYKRRTQRWDMGGSFLDLKDAPFNG